MSDDNGTSQAGDIDLCAVGELEESRVTEVSAGGRTFGVARCDGRVYVFNPRCPHRAGPMCKGAVRRTLTSPEPGVIEVDPRSAVITCPWHGWEFRLPSGDAIADPVVHLRMYDARVESGRVIVSRAARQKPGEKQ